MGASLVPSPAWGWRALSRDLCKPRRWSPSCLSPHLALNRKHRTFSSHEIVLTLRSPAALQLPGNSHGGRGALLEVSDAPFTPIRVRRLHQADRGRIQNSRRGGGLHLVLRVPLRDFPPADGSRRQGTRPCLSHCRNLSVVTGLGLRQGSSLLPKRSCLS